MCKHKLRKVTSYWVLSDGNVSGLYADRIRRSSFNYLFAYHFGMSPFSDLDYDIE